MKHFYIFRHGESTYNVENRVQGHSDDSQLTEKGRLQAVETAQRLKDKHIEIIISSPLKRAIQTGNIVAGELNVPIVTDERFIEVNVGVIEGLTYDEVLRQHGELYKKWRSSDRDKTDVCFENGETRKNVRRRVFDALNFYAEDSRYDNIAVSGHGIIVIQALLALGIEQNDIPNGSVVHLSYEQKQWDSHGFVSH